MRMILICETDAEREEVARIFDKMVADAAAGVEDENFMDGGVPFREDGSADLFPTYAPTVYAWKGDFCTAYNFRTGEKTERVHLPQEELPTL